MVYNIVLFISGLLFPTDSILLCDFYDRNQDYNCVWCNTSSCVISKQWLIEYVHIDYWPVTYYVRISKDANNVHNILPWTDPKFQSSSITILVYGPTFRHTSPLCRNPRGGPFHIPIIKGQ